ncbi:MAG: hypothetical protein PHO01_10610 [Desulfotomaculaceae bacterium]|nr:hypothetical protein [Desulfotomaculaceae bacterium]
MQKKTAKKRNKRAHEKKARTLRKNNPSLPILSDLPNIKLLTRPWQVFYRLVIEELKQK